MKKINFDGYTIAEAIKEIKKRESKNSVFMIYVIERKEIFKNFKKCFKNHHLRNKDGKRIYYTTNTLYYYYAQNKDLEKDKIIIDSFIEKGKHSNLSFSGFVSDGEHNEYYLVIEKITKGNKGKAHAIKTDKKEYEYKEGELTPKQRRFTL